MSDPPPIPVCGIGASAGGIEALQHFFSDLPIDLGLAYVVVVHLAPDRKSELPHILSRATAMTVTQVADHEEAKLEPNHVYVIAPDRKLEISDTSVSASPFDQPRGQRSAIDLFFRSLAEKHGDGFAVVLSGTGSDGALGAKAIKERGGLILVQDPADAAYGDMPRSVINSGVADVVLPVGELSKQLADLSRQKRQILPVIQAVDEPDAIPENEDRALRGVLELLRKRTGHDFTKYKRSSVLRRLLRRMQLAQQVTIQNYLQHIRANQSEIQALFNDLLISVTTFFRDPDSWRALQTSVIARLVEREEGQIRVWVPGCATGEEAYSMAMLFHEEFDRRKIRRNLVVFASDVDDAAIAVAREALYPRGISDDVSEERLERFFHLEDDHYRLQGEIRDNVVFAVHSVFRDPPFSRVHLISCRNLLIYLDRDLQEHVMAIFRYACRDDGYLFLGASEMASDELFQTVDAKHRIFSVREHLGHERLSLPAILASTSAARFTAEPGPSIAPRSSAAEMHVAALENAAPPSILVDDRWNVLHLSSTASRFLQQSGGVLARRLTDLVRPELRDDLHLVLHHALERTGPQLSPFAPVQFNGAPHRVAMLATRTRTDDTTSARVLVTFLDAGEIPSDDRVSQLEPTDETVRDLRDKLRQAELRIETMRDDHFLTTEDLRAANEELQSLNEEYRSTTEELETSKEELQSINEELQTVNQELKLKLEDVSRTHADLENFMAASDVPILFIDREMRIKRFTPRLADIFNVRTRDYDRPIGDLTHTLDYSAFQADAKQILTGNGSASIERDARSAAGRSYIVRLSAYRDPNSQDVEGIVVSFLDVTAIKQAELALRESEQRLESELEIMRHLHRLTVEVAKVPTLKDALEFLLVNAIELHGADFGNVQMPDPASHALHIVAERGFGASFLKHFELVDANDDTACGRALRTKQSCQIGDVESDPGYTPYRAAAKEAGYRAVQSTPLVSRDGDVIGVLSVHFRQPHTFTRRDQQLADLLGHQAAGLIAMRMHQEELAQLNDALKKRTSELEASQQQLSAKAAELMEQDRHREEFLATLGHELRNPMSAIQSAVSLLAVSDERSQRAQAVLDRQTRHMTRLINDLLDTTRIRHGRLRLERIPVDLVQAVLAAIEIHRPRAEAKGLSIAQDFAPGSISVDADPERIAQILDNLLRNAVTFTDTGTVTVTIRRDAARASVSIRDTGIGLAPEEVTKLFEPFTRLDPRRDRGGLGLGLALVRNLVEAHGGTIVASSAGRGRGSEFSFTLPLAAASASAPPASPVSVPAPRRILVVDDQRDVADAFGELLQLLGQEVRVVHSGEEALAVARVFRPRVAFVDLAMPEMGGADVARRLREEFTPNDLTLVAVTGFGGTEQAARGPHFDHHLLKPVTADQAAVLLNSLA